MAFTLNRRATVLGLGAVGLATGVGLAGCATLPAAGADTVLLLTYFTATDEGRAGLKLAVSDDGYVFNALRGGAGFLTPMVGENRLMRDPSISLGPAGLYHLVWTSDWFGPVIGHATSTDLKTWSEQQTLPVMAAFPGVRNTWAPEAVWDQQAGHWVIIWSSSVAGQFGATAQTGFDGLNHRPYVTTTTDFQIFSPTRLLYDPGFNSIDFTWLRLSDGRWKLIFKDETNTPELKRWLVSADATSPAGPFGPASAPFTQSWTEGPTAIAFEDGYLVFYDVYEDHHFGARFTRDFVTWDDRTARVKFPADARHGTVIRVPRALADALA